MRPTRAAVEIHSPRPYQPRWIPAGTRVKSRVAGRYGVVQPYRANPLGLFSVTFADGLSEVVTVEDVAIVVEPAVKDGAA